MSMKIVFGKARSKITSFYEKSINIHQKRLCCEASKELTLLYTSYQMNHDRYSLSVGTEWIVRIIDIEKSLERNWNNTPTKAGEGWYAILPESRQIVLVRITGITDDWVEICGVKYKFEDVEFIRPSK